MTIKMFMQQAFVNKIIKFCYYSFFILMIMYFVNYYFNPHEAHQKPKVYVVVYKYNLKFALNFSNVFCYVSRMNKYSKNINICESNGYSEIKKTDLFMERLFNNMVEDMRKNMENISFKSVNNGFAWRFFHTAPQFYGIEPNNYIAKEFTSKKSFNSSKVDNLISENLLNHLKLEYFNFDKNEFLVDKKTNQVLDNLVNILFKKNYIPERDLIYFANNIFHALKNNQINQQLISYKKDYSIVFKQSDIQKLIEYNYYLSDIEKNNSNLTRKIDLSYMLKIYEALISNKQNLYNLYVIKN